VAAAVVSGDQIVWSQGYGFANKSSGTKIDGLHSIFRIGSISKVFTSLAMFKARDEGRLNLDDEVRKYAPDFYLQNPFTSSGKRDITFQQLASHLAGLPREIPCLDSCKFNNSEAFRRLHSLRMILPVDTLPVYSNLGFAILGNVLAQIHRQPFETYMKEKVLEPMGLLETGVDVTKAPLAHLALPYNPDGTECSAAECLSDFGWADPAGSFYSSCNDLAKVMIMLLNPRPASSDQLIDGATIRESFLSQFIFTDKQSGFATPWELYYLDNYLLRTKRGDVNGYSSAIFMVPEIKLGIVVLTNNWEQSPPYVEAMSGILIPAFDAVFRSVEQIPQTPPNWKDYVGNYSNSEAGGSIIVFGNSQNGMNYLSAYSKEGIIDASALEWLGNEHLFRMVAPAGDLESCLPRVLDNFYQYVQFVAAPNGRITGLTMPGLTYTLTFHR
jgi:CubicO group peptidase (beta-lactamase class C family)